MHPEVHIGGIPSKTFGVRFALRFLACAALDWRRPEVLGHPPERAYEVISWPPLIEARGGTRALRPTTA
ncbi:MAG TPA: hypothetical protein VMA83_04685 [Solirubrobacteraceae bacterium]|nr:hypothetical protein [Solirubrobacteraceae bacterium]